MQQQVQRQQQVDTRCTGPTRGPFAFVAWCLVLPILILSHFICFVLCEFLVVLMPMAKVRSLWRRSLSRRNVRLAAN